MINTGLDSRPLIESVKIDEAVSGRELVQGPLIIFIFLVGMIKIDLSIQRERKKR